MPRKSKLQIQAVDKFIAQNYPLHGAKFCAEALNETVDYIRIRAGVKKIKLIDKTGKDLIKFVRNLNKSLRLENIKLIDENRRLKLIVNC